MIRITRSIETSQISADFLFIIAYFGPKSKTPGCPATVKKKCHSATLFVQVSSVYHNLCMHTTHSLI